MIDEKQIEQAIASAKEQSQGRNFVQRYDFVVTLKDIDLKKSDQQVDFFHSLPHSTGKQATVCGLVGPELIDEAKGALDHTVPQSEFDTVAAKKAEVKKLASQYDFFVAQANVMPKVAQYFGRILGPRGKMPNPKAGCVVPPKAQLGPVKERLQKMVRITAKAAPNIQVPVGNQSMDDETVKENIVDIYNAIVSHLPQGENNVKKVFVKLTMSKPQRIS